MRAARFLIPLLALPLSLAAWRGGEEPATTPRLVFTKEFPGSNPDYYRISLDAEGWAAYYTAPDETPGQQFRVSPPLARQAFDLAARLNHFRDVSLETRRKVAAMGKKTVVYENGSERNQAVFNYSENPDAAALAELFEKISNTRQHIIALERLARFDRLGLMKQLLNTESALNKKDLAEPVLLVPILEEIAANKAYMHIVQQRAKIILSKIESPKM